MQKISEVSIDSSLDGAIAKLTENAITVEEVANLKEKVNCKNSPEPARTHPRITNKFKDKKTNNCGITYNALKLLQQQNRGQYA